MRNPVDCVVELRRLRSLPTSTVSRSATASRGENRTRLARSRAWLAANGRSCDRRPGICGRFAHQSPSRPVLQRLPDAPVRRRDSAAGSAGRLFLRRPISSRSRASDASARSSRCFSTSRDELHVPRLLARRRRRKVASFVRFALADGRVRGRPPAFRNRTSCRPDRSMSDACGAELYSRSALRAMVSRAGGGRGVLARARGCGPSAERRRSSRGRQCCRSRAEPGEVELREDDPIGREIPREVLGSGLERPRPIHRSHAQLSS